jgi:hypothetical protein
VGLGKRIGLGFRFLRSGGIILKMRECGVV